MSVKAEKEGEGGGLCFWTACFPDALLGNLDITQPHMSNGTKKVLGNIIAFLQKVQNLEFNIKVQSISVFISKVMLKEIVLGNNQNTLTIIDTTF